MTNTDKPIVLFDGTCVLCSRWVNFVFRYDHHHKLIFLALQSDKGQELLRSKNLKEKQMDTIVLIKGDKLFIKSDAIIEIFGSIGGLLNIFKAGIVTPRFVRDWIYDLVAKNRYRIFGKQDQCIVRGSGELSFGLPVRKGRSQD